MADGLTWQMAKDVLSPAEIQRMACLFFNYEGGKVNYEAAARDYGAASSGSMRVMVGTILRKIKAAHEGTAGDSAAGGVVTTAPVMGKKRSGGKKGAGAAGKPAKRSAATAGDGDEDDEEVKNEDREVPGKKRKVADAGAEAELDVGIKAEPGLSNDDAHDGIA